MDIDNYQKRWSKFLEDPASFLAQCAPKLNQNDIYEDDKLCITEDETGKFLVLKNDVYMAIIVVPINLLEPREFKNLNNQLNKIYDESLKSPELNHLKEEIEIIKLYEWVDNLIGDAPRYYKIGRKSYRFSKVSPLSFENFIQQYTLSQWNKPTPTDEYLNLINYPKGIMGDLLLAITLEKLAADLNFNILLTLIQQIEDFAKYKINSVYCFKNDDRTAISIEGLKKLNDLCVYCGCQLKLPGTGFCDAKCRSNAIKNNNFLRFLTYDCPNHPNTEKKLPFYKSSEYISGEYEAYKSLKPRKQRTHHTKLFSNKCHGIYDTLMIKSDELCHHIQKNFLKSNKKIKSNKEQERFDTVLEEYISPKILRKLSLQRVIITNLNLEFTKANAIKNNKIANLDTWEVFHNNAWGNPGKKVTLQEIKFDELSKRIPKYRRETVLLSEAMITSRIEYLLSDRQKVHRSRIRPNNHQWSKGLALKKQ